jgi:Transglycosylase SLT domain
VKLLYKFGIATALLALACVAGSCAEIAVLRNCFSIRHERREGRGAQTRLYLDKTQDNYVEVSTMDIAGFESGDPSSPPAIAFEPRRNLDQMVRAAGKQNNIDPDLINSVIRAESGFNPNAISPKGAQGLMQLMPRTAVQLGVLNAMDPAANVEGGTRYLRELLARYHNDLVKALAAYNAGPERVEQYRGMPPIPKHLPMLRELSSTSNARSSPGGTRNRIVQATSGWTGIPMPIRWTCRPVLTLVERPNDARKMFCAYSLQITAQG